MTMTSESYVAHAMTPSRRSPAHSSTTSPCSAVGGPLDLLRRPILCMDYVCSWPIFPEASSRGCRSYFDSTPPYYLQRPLRHREQLMYAPGKGEREGRRWTSMDDEHACMHARTQVWHPTACCESKVAPRSQDSLAIPFLSALGGGSRSRRGVQTRRTDKSVGLGVDLTWRLAACPLGARRLEFCCHYHTCIPLGFLAARFDISGGGRGGGKSKLEYRPCLLVMYIRSYNRNVERKNGNPRGRRAEWGPGGPPPPPDWAPSS